MIDLAVHRYQAVQIRTSSPGELLIALFDGLFKFLTVAKHSLTNKKRTQASEAISRAHAIISELYVSLDHNQAAELCANLAAVYDFCMHRLLQANLKNDPDAIGDVMRVLTPIREAFTTVVRNEASNRPAAAGAEGY